MSTVFPREINYSSLCTFTSTEHRYVKKSKAQPAPAGSAVRGGGFGGVGFENPLYDENPSKAEGSGPQYADAPTEAQQESGYMDVPAEGDEGGYLDVDDGEEDEDNF